MIHSAITISLVPEARGGPFVFWDDLAAGCARAAALGFDAVEIFPRSTEEILQQLSDLNTGSNEAASEGDALILTSAISVICRASQTLCWTRHGMPDFF